MGQGTGNHNSGKSSRAGMPRSAYRMPLVDVCASRNAGKGLKSDECGGT